MMTNIPYIQKSKTKRETITSKGQCRTTVHESLVTELMFDDFVQTHIKIVFFFSLKTSNDTKRLSRSTSIHCSQN